MLLSSPNIGQNCSGCHETLSNFSDFNHLILLLQSCSRSVCDIMRHPPECLAVHVQADKILQDIHVLNTSPQYMRCCGEWPVYRSLAQSAIRAERFRPKSLLRRYAYRFRDETFKKLHLLNDPSLFHPSKAYSPEVFATVHFVLPACSWG